MPAIYQTKVDRHTPAEKHGKRRVVWLDRAARARRRAMLIRSIDAMSVEMKGLHIEHDPSMNNLPESPIESDDERVWDDLRRVAAMRQVDEVCDKLGQIDLLATGPLYDMASLEDSLPVEWLPDITDMVMNYLDRASTAASTTQLIASVAMSKAYLDVFEPQDHKEQLCVCPLDVFSPPSDFEDSSSEGSDSEDSDEDATYSTDSDSYTDTDSDSCDMTVDYCVEQVLYERPYHNLVYDASESESESESEYNVLQWKSVQRSDRKQARSVARKSRGFHPFARPSGSESDFSASSRSGKRSPGLRSRSGQI